MTTVASSALWYGLPQKRLFHYDAACDLNRPRRSNRRLSFSAPYLAAVLLTILSLSTDGTFALSNLPPGKYFALTQTNDDAQIATQAKLREPETEAAAARAKLRRAAETKKSEIELKPCQNLADYQLKE